MCTSVAAQTWDVRFNVLPKGLKCLRELRRISYFNKTNNWVRSKIHFLVGPQEPLLATVKRRTLAWFGHVTRRDRLSNTTLRDTF